MSLSTLYPLPPLPSESLTSYVRRLARTHRVSVSLLLRELILIPHARLRGKVRLYFDVTAARETINGSTPATALVLEQLGELTSRTDLSSLALVEVAEALRLHRDFRESRAWCPRCLADGYPYDRQIWSLAAAVTCPVHDCALIDRCPSRSCRRQHRPWHARATPDRCPHCGADLARADVRAGRDACTSALDDVLEYLAAGGTISTTNVAAGFAHAASRLGTQSALARAVEITSAGMNLIVLGRARTSLTTLARTLATTNERCADFLGHGDRQPVPVIKRRPNGRQHDLTALRSMLDAAIALPPARRVSLAAMAAEAGAGPDFVRAMFPAHCQRISADARALKSQQRALKERAEGQEVVAAVRALARSGVLPSPRRVARRLTSPTVLRTRHGQDAFWEARAQTPWPAHMRGQRVV